MSQYLIYGIVSKIGLCKVWLEMTYIRVRGRSVKTKELHCGKRRYEVMMKVVDKRDRVD